MATTPRALLSTLFFALFFVDGQSLSSDYPVKGWVVPASDWFLASSDFLFYYNKQENARLMGGASVGRPCCTSIRSGRVDCFILTPDNILQHQINENGKRGAWRNYPYASGTIESFTCLNNGQGRIDLLFIDRTGVLHAGWYADGKYDEKKYVGIYNEAPSCTVRRPGVVDCLVRNVYNRPYHIVDDEGNWQKPVPVKTVRALRSHPSCYPQSQTSLVCLGSSYQNKLEQSTYHAKKGWSHWDMDDEITNKGKPLLTQIDNRMMVIIQGESNDYGWLFLGDAEAVSMGGNFTSHPECVRSADGRSLHCFGVALKSHLYYNAYKGGSWGGWKDIGGPYIERPSCVLYEEKKILCYLRGFNKDIIQVTQEIE